MQEVWTALFEIPHKSPFLQSGFARTIGLLGVFLSLFFIFAQVAALLVSSPQKLSNGSELFSFIIILLIFFASIYVLYIVFFLKHRRFITDKGIAGTRPPIAFTPKVTIANGSETIAGGLTLHWEETLGFYIAKPYLVFVMKRDPIGLRRGAPPPYPVIKIDGREKNTLGYFLDSGFEDAATKLRSFIPELNLNTTGG